MMSDTVRTKLRIPETEARLVPRPQLMQIFDEGLHRKLTVVSAPAGYGKTTSVAMWARTLDHPSPRTPTPDSRPANRVAWCSLDPEDDDINTFFDRFAAAIDVVAPGALRVVATGSTVDPPPVNEYANTLSEACLGLPQPVVLVLDDYHLITDSGIHAILMHVIQYASAKLHLVIVTRRDPPLRIPRLRAQRQVAEIRAADLRFTELEATELLGIRLERRPSTELVAALQTRTEGWVAGLQLAAVAVYGRDDLDAFADDFRRNDNLYVMDYLFDEVLDRQPEDAKEFLLKTALLARFTAQVAAQVTGRDSAACRRILDRLRRENLFVVALDSAGDWYRYHRQFHAMLEDRARLTFSPDEIGAIRRDAADWLAGQGWTDEALAEYIANEDWSRAADLVELDRHRLQNREEWHLLWRRIAQLPDEIVTQRPGLMLARAWILQVHNRVSAIPPLIDRADVLLEAAPGAGVAAREAMQGEIYALRGSWIYPNSAPGQQIEYLNRALAVLSAPQYAWVRGFVYIQLANILVSQGQRDAAYRLVADEIQAAGPASGVLLTRLYHTISSIVYRDGALSKLDELATHYHQLAAENAMPMAVGWARFAQGWAHYQLGQPEQAMEALLPLFDQLYAAHMETLTMALAVLVPVADALGRGEQAARLIDQVRTVALERQNVAAVDELLALAAHAALLRGDRRAAKTWAHGFAQSLSQLFSSQGVAPRSSQRVLIFAKIALAMDSPDQLDRAADLLQMYVDITGARNDIVYLVQGAALLARCQWRAGRTAQALSWMQKAVDLGWPRGFRQVFFEGGPETASILYRMVERNVSTEAASMLLVEYGALQFSPRTAGHDLVMDDTIAPLSERETEVLGLLAQRLSNKEIARRLDLSPLTVRNHTSSIYGKLNVATRKQAVAQAQRLGLLPAGS